MIERVLKSRLSIVLTWGKSFAEALRTSYEMPARTFLTFLSERLDSVTANFGSESKPSFVRPLSCTKVDFSFYWSLSAIMFMRKSKVFLECLRLKMIISEYKFLLMFVC